MEDVGINNSLGQAITNPVPQAWMGRADAPAPTPMWVTIGPMSSTQVRQLQAQIGYDHSAWDYRKIGPFNELGRYQINSRTLEYYGLISSGSNAEYGYDCVNYQHCWNPIYIKNTTNPYSNYFYNNDSLSSFLASPIGQDHLCYQILSDLYTELYKIGAILDTDSADVVSGMLYVAWNLGVGTPTGVLDNPIGSGAYAWRYFGLGNGTKSFNRGRYASTQLMNYINPTSIDTTKQYFVKITGTTTAGNTVSVVTPITGPATVTNISTAVKSASSQLGDIATATNFSLVQQPTSTDNTEPVITTIDDQNNPTINPLMSGISSPTKLIQQTTPLTSTVLSTFSSGVVGGIAKNIGAGGSTIVGSVASIVVDPKTTVQAIENMAVVYGILANFASSQTQ